MRQGFEDYRLIRLLQERGQTEAVAELLKAFEAGADLDELHERALRLAEAGS